MILNNNKGVNSCEDGKMKFSLKEVDSTFSLNFHSLHMISQNRHKGVTKVHLPEEKYSKRFTKCHFKVVFYFQ